MKVRDDLKPSEEEDDTKKPENAEATPKLDEEDTLLAEMDELREAMEAKKLKAKKVAARRKAKVG